MLNDLVGLWKIARGITSSEIRRQMELPITVVITGDKDSIAAVSERLGSPTARLEPLGVPFVSGSSTIVFDANRLAPLSQIEFSKELANVASENKGRRIALALNVPAFRPTVVQRISHERAAENSRIAAISALPGILPVTDWLMPATAVGDLLLLTRNQITLLLEVAACYGKPPEPKARLKELLPIIGSAFGWRTVARELVGLVPGGIGLVVKAAIAYAGTYSVGRAAAFYYSGESIKMTADQMRTFYRSALAEGFTKARGMLARG